MKTHTDEYGSTYSYDTEPNTFGVAMKAMSDATGVPTRMLLGQADPYIWFEPVNGDEVRYETTIRNMQKVHADLVAEHWRYPPRMDFPWAGILLTLAGVAAVIFGYLTVAA